MGLRGEMKVSPLTDFPERFNNLREVRIQTKKGLSSYEIERASYRNPFVYISLKGLSSSEEARSLAGGLIQIPEEDRIALPEGSYYQFEIKGLDVYLEGGRFLGKVTDILRTGANDVYVVGQGEKEYLIPALRSVVKEINLSEKRMTLHPMEGLLE